MEIDEKHKQNATFSVPSNKHFDQNRLCFGICNAPPTFQQIMDKIPGGLLNTDFYCYIDALTICSSTGREHAVRLGYMLQRLENAYLKMQPGEQWRTQEYFSGGVQQIQLRTDRMGIWGR